jgi:hypothetical protein
LARLTHLKIYFDQSKKPSPKEFLLSQINGNSNTMNEIYSKVSDFFEDCSFDCIKKITNSLIDYFKNKSIRIRFSLDEANASANFLDGAIYSYKGNLRNFLVSMSENVFSLEFYNYSFSGTKLNIQNILSTLVSTIGKFELNLKTFTTDSYNYLENKKDVIEYLGLCLGDVKVLIENNNINIDQLIGRIRTSALTIEYLVYDKKISKSKNLKLAISNSYSMMVSGLFRKMEDVLLSNKENIQIIERILISILIF